MQYVTKKNLMRHLKIDTTEIGVLVKIGALPKPLKFSNQVWLWRLRDLPQKFHPPKSALSELKSACVDMGEMSLFLGVTHSKITQFVARDRLLKPKKRKGKNYWDWARINEWLSSQFDKLSGEKK